MKMENDPLGTITVVAGFRFQSSMETETYEFNEE